MVDCASSNRREPPQLKTQTPSRLSGAVFLLTNELIGGTRTQSGAGR